MRAALGAQGLTGDAASAGSEGLLRSAASHRPVQQGSCRSRSRAGRAAAGVAPCADVGGCVGVLAQLSVHLAAQNQQGLLGCKAQTAQEGTAAGCAAGWAASAGNARASFCAPCCKAQPCRDAAASTSSLGSRLGQSWRWVQLAVSRGAQQGGQYRW